MYPIFHALADEPSPLCGCRCVSYVERRRLASAVAALSATLRQPAHTHRRCLLVMSVRSLNSHTTAQRYQVVYE